VTVLKKLSQYLNTINEVIGRAIAWLVLALTVIVVYDVSMRYLFREGSVALQEIEWHFFALIFLLGAAYTYKHNDHVRVEIIYQRLNPRQQLWVDALGDLFFLIPLCVIVIKSSWPFVGLAYDIMERSPDAGGLPWRYLIKSAIPAGFGLLALQAIANVIDKFTQLFMVSDTR